MSAGGRGRFLVISKVALHFEMANGHLRDSVVDQFFSTGDVSDSFDRESDGANRHPGGLWGWDENIPIGFADSYGS